MSEEEEAAFAAEFAQGSHGGFGPSFHRFDRGEDRGVLLVREFGDSVEEALDGFNLGCGQGLGDGGIHLAIDVADEENPFMG